MAASYHPCSISVERSESSPDLLSRPPALGKASVARLRVRPVQPFLSSTFSDLRTERKYLREKVFPELRKRATSMGGDFSPVDLQWVRDRLYIAGCVTVVHADRESRSKRPNERRK